MALNRRVELIDESLGVTLRRIQAIRTDDLRFDAIPVGYRIRCSDQVFAELDRDPLLLQQVSTAAARATNDRAKLFVAGKNLATVKVDQAFVNGVKTHFEGGQTLVSTQVKQVLDHHAQMNAAWGKYWKSTAKDLAIAAISVTASVAGLALAMPTGGVSIGLAVVGLVRGIIGGIAKLVDCYLKAEQIENRLRDNIRKLMSTYGLDVNHYAQVTDANGVTTSEIKFAVKSGGKTTHTGRAAQIGGQVVNTLTSGPAVATMKLVESDLAQWKGKLASLHQIAHELAVQLNRCLNEIDVLEVQLPPNHAKRLAALREKLSALLDHGVSRARFRDTMTISGAYARYEKGWERAIKLGVALDDMKAAADTRAGHKGVAIGSAFAAFLTNAAFTIHNYDGALLHTGLVDSFSWDPSHMKQTGTVAGVGGDFLGVAMDAREIFGAFKGESPEEAAEFARVEAAFLHASMPVVYTSPIPLPNPAKVLQTKAGSHAPNKPLPPTPTPKLAATASRPPNRPPPPRPGA